MDDETAQKVFVETQLAELKQLYEMVKSLEAAKKNHALVSLGKGVSLPAMLLPESAYIEVGAGIVLKKSYNELAEVLEQQISTLRKTQIALAEHVQ